MDFTQIASNLPAVLIPIALIVYYTNQNNIKWMADRTELLKAIMAERKEWVDWQAATIERQFDQQERRLAIQERVAIVLESLKAEMHATRGKIQEVLSRYELIAPPKDRSGGSDD